MKFNLRARRKIITINEIEIDGKWFAFNQVYEALEGLEGTDMIERLVIYVDGLGEALEKIGVATRDGRGRYARADGFNDFMNYCGNLRFPKPEGAIEGLD